jgi:hypothetical protein
MESTQHEILIGRKENGELRNQLIAGASFLNDGESFYTIRLMMFPNQAYYLTKNHESTNRYTVFSKFIKTENGIKFQNPVGSGRLSVELSAYLEIYFPVIRSQMFMCLYPTAS